jgi:hypothetical protein
MSRVDLLALTPDDLAAMTNRGTVKRAQKELEVGTLRYSFHESGEEVVCEWSDSIVCRFPAGKTVHDAVCSSGVLGISRHIVRSVLAYQQYKSSAPSVSVAATDPTVIPAVAEPSEAVPATAQESVVPLAAAEWNPGDITDDQLIAQFRSATISKTRQRFDRGVLVELVLGAKPLARFLDESCTIRFLVPGDARYVSADCSEGLLGTFVPMAVWAFRRLEAGRRSGIVAIQQTASDVPDSLLQNVESLVTELCTDGLQGISTTWPQRLMRQEASCRESGLIWPAELLADMLQQREMYASRDAVFDPIAVVRLTGELLIRCRAIRRGTTAIPQLLIRGSRSDQSTDLASSRLVGLGSSVRRSRRAVTVTAFLQDSDAGSVVGVERTFADPAEDSPDSPASFASLSQTVISRGISLSAIGAGQLLIKTGKRTPGGRLILPRTAASISLNPQSFQWEHLRSPLAVEGFAELSARLDLLPPSSLRPRRLTEGLHACPIKAIEEVSFDIQSQRLRGTVIDLQGERAEISHPYTTRGRSGFERLSEALADPARQARFVCGQVSRRRSGILIEPICVVFETDDGKRQGVFPWTDSGATATTIDHDDESPATTTSTLASLLGELQFELSEIQLNGLRRIGPQDAKRWTSLSSQLNRAGLLRLGERATRLSAHLLEQSELTNWDPTNAIAETFQLLLLTRLADDIGWD